MNASVRTLFGAFAAVAAFEVSAIAGPLEEGIDAYRARDYARAAEMWRPLADKGDAVAQFRLGILYAEGNGVERNDATAFAWFQRAADQGYADAQYDVGASYSPASVLEKTTRRRPDGSSVPPTRAWCMHSSISDFCMPLATGSRGTMSKR